MKLKHVVRGILPYAVTKVYLDKRDAKKSDIPYPVYQQRFEEVAACLEDDGRFICSWDDRFPCLNDAKSFTPFEPHYTYHPAWAARILAETMPARHVDIGSSLSFVAQVSAFVPMQFYDYRPAQLHLPNIQCLAADITNLPFEDASIASLSCMHVVEHIGLERYGDTFDPQGDIKAMNELQRVIAPGGQLLFVVPVAGKQKIAYNAHRIYTYDGVLSIIKNLKLCRFSLITDRQELVWDATRKDSDEQQWGCGCFYFKNDNMSV